MKSKLLLAAIVAVASLIALDALRASQLRADLRVAIDGARELDDALKRYHEQHGSYPDSWSSPGLDPITLDPLRKRGYYDGILTSVLLDRRIDAYHAPDGVTRCQEFWVEMTLARDPSIRLLIADSDDAPLAAGRWLDGVYVYRAGRLEETPR